MGILRESSGGWVIKFFKPYTSQNYLNKYLIFMILR